MKQSRMTLPAQVVLTLLPFMGKIVYDGTISGAIIRDESLMAEAGGVVEEAVKNGTVIRQLPELVDTPLVGKMVLIQDLKSRPDLNGTKVMPAAIFSSSAN